MKSNLSLAAALLSLGISVSLYFFNGRGKKIAYVRSTELVYGYIGMKEGHNKYEQQAQAWQANIDTLKAEYQHDLSTYSAEVSRLGKQEKEAREKMLKEKQQSLMGYAQSIDKKAQQEDKKMTEGVLNQINSFIAGYGKEKGYDVILGTTESGSLMYGNDAIDITREVLESLNRSYKGESLK